MTQKREFNTDAHGSHDLDWTITLNNDNNSWSYDQITVMLLADIRRELRKLNATFRCSRFQMVPTVLSTIEKNTRKKPRKRLKRKVSPNG